MMAGRPVCAKSAVNTACLFLVHIPLGTCKESNVALLYSITTVLTVYAWVYHLVMSTIEVLVDQKMMFIYNYAQLETVELNN